MFAFGQKHDVYQSEINEFSSNKKLSKRGILASASEGVLQRVRREFPSVARLLQDIEADAGVKRIEIMGGADYRRFLANSLFISEDLGNAVHEDVHDACKCICVWKETLDGMAKNWYFVMPDMIGTYPVMDEKGTRC